MSRAISRSFAIKGRINWGSSWRGKESFFVHHGAILKCWSAEGNNDPWGVKMQRREGKLLWKQWGMESSAQVGEALRLVRSTSSHHPQQQDRRNNPRPQGQAGKQMKKWELWGVWTKVRRFNSLRREEKVWNGPLGE